MVLTVKYEEQHICKNTGFFLIIFYELSWKIIPKIFENESQIFYR